MANKLSLPSSSLNELARIVQGYSHFEDSVTLDDLAQLVGIHRTSVSGNNRFLTEVGLISGGKVKTATPLGKTLGRALALSQTEDAILAWKEAVQSHEKLAGLVTTVRLKDGMSSDDLARHILYVSGQKDTKQNRTGARTIIDILLAAKLLEEKDGRLVVSSASEASAPKARNLEGELEFGEKRDMERVDTVRSISRPVQPDISPTIAINIQLQLPETENSEVYEKLFRALRKHLIDHDE